MDHILLICGRVVQETGRRRTCGSSTLLTKTCSGFRQKFDPGEDRKPVFGDFIIAGAATVVIFGHFLSLCRELKRRITKVQDEICSTERQMNANYPRYSSTNCVGIAEPNSQLLWQVEQRLSNLET